MWWLATGNRNCRFYKFCCLLIQIRWKINKNGIGLFQNRFGERIPEDVVYSDGSDPHKMHNYYSYLYNKTVYDILYQESKNKQVLVFARSGTVGNQKFPVHWGGDCSASYESMAESLRGGLSLCLSGYGFGAMILLDLKTLLRQTFINVGLPLVYYLPIVDCMGICHTGFPGTLIMNPVRY